MNFGVEASGKPYVQVAASLRTRIIAGEFPIGSQLPTNRKLAELYDVAPNTIGNALGILRNEGIVASQQGRGTFVRAMPGDPVGGGLTSDYITSAFDEVQGQLRTLNARLTHLEDVVGERSQDSSETPEAQRNR